MTLRPGRTLLIFSGFAVGLAAVAFYLPTAAWLLAPLLAAAIGLAIFDGFWLRRHRSQLRVVRELPPIAGRDVSFEIMLRCSNSGSHPLRGSLREVIPAEAEPQLWTADFPAAGISGKVEFRNVFQIARRGQFEFGPTWVRLIGPCRALEALWPATTPTRIKIFPEGLVATDDLSQNMAAEIEILDRRSRSRRRSAGTEFESIADFRAGDDSRRIDWRSTARMRRLVVRRFQVEQHQDVILLIDCGRLMGTHAGRGSKLDCAVDAALLLSRVALANGDRCGVALFDNQVTGFLPAPFEPVGFFDDRRLCFNAQSRWSETDFAAMFAHLQSQHRKRALMIVLSDMGDEETSRQALAALSHLAARHVVIFAALQTPLLLAQTRLPITNRLEAARQAVAYRLLREREKTLHALRRGNVQVIDVEPADLTVPLINRYLDLRSRNVM